MIGRLLVLMICLMPAPSLAQNDARVILQSTTSTQNSGLLDAILPVFEDASGYDVQVVAVGTGQALKNAELGDGDVVLVHARELEDQFVAQGWGVKRYDLMHNDFVIVGPETDPAGIGGAASGAAALARIAASGARFASRGDGSGTHIREMQLWAAAGLDPVPHSGGWYRELGAGMGTTLNAAVQMRAYTLTDRGTWISFGNKGSHRPLFQGDPALFNPYGLILVNPARHRHVNAAGGQALIDWLTGADGQAAIAGYRLQGQQLFFPNAAP